MILEKKRFWIISLSMRLTYIYSLLSQPYLTKVEFEMVSRSLIQNLRRKKSKQEYKVCQENKNMFCYSLSLNECWLSPSEGHHISFILSNWRMPLYSSFLAEPFCIKIGWSHAVNSLYPSGLKFWTTKPFQQSSNEFVWCSNNNICLYFAIRVE